MASRGRSTWGSPERAPRPWAPGSPWPTLQHALRDGWQHPHVTGGAANIVVGFGAGLWQRLQDGRAVAEGIGPFTELEGRDGPGARHRAPVRAGSVELCARPVRDSWESPDRAIFTDGVVTTRPGEAQLAASPHGERVLEGIEPAWRCRVCCDDPRGEGARGTVEAYRHGATVRQLQPLVNREGAWVGVADQR